MSQKVHTVSEITSAIKRNLENGFPYFWVKGEVTNLSRASSGHVYFSLKDENALLSCVWYKHQQKDLTFDMSTGEVFDKPQPSLAKSLENGKEMLFAGNLNVYAPRGTYQLVVDTAKESGQGLLAQAFENMKKKLFSLGWFDEARKKTIPLNPQKVAVLTSAFGAVVHDFCRISRQYGTSSKICIYPVAVQGKEAAVSIAEAIERVNKEKWADVIVLIRGGGSLEDLWAFNEEMVATAIFQSKLPVVTGIGHQVDSTIADFVADKSGATPSHVVSLLWEQKADFIQGIEDLENRLQQKFSLILNSKISLINSFNRQLQLASPQQQLMYKKQQFLFLEEKLKGCTSFFKAKKEQFDVAFQNLQYQSNFLKKKEEELAEQVAKLPLLLKENIQRKEERIVFLHQIIQVLNPYTPLKKGYAFVGIGENGKKLSLVKSIEQIPDTAKLSLEFADGILFVETKTYNKEKRKLEDE